MVLVGVGGTVHVAARGNSATRPSNDGSPKFDLDFDLDLKPAEHYPLRYLGERTAGARERLSVAAAQCLALGKIIEWSAYILVQ